MARQSGSVTRFLRRQIAPNAPQAPELIAALPIALFVIDPDSVVSDANVAAEILLNLSKVAIIGRPLAELLGSGLPQPAGDSPFAAYDFEIGMPGSRRQRVDLVAAPLPDRAT